MLGAQYGEVRSAPFLIQKPLQLNLAFKDKQQAVSRGATDFTDREWAAAAVVESWLQAWAFFLMGNIDKATMQRIDDLVNSI